jgi:predicted nucleic acid-binding protein
MAEKRLIISNTSPIINLAEIGHLELFELLGDKVHIPGAVRDELCAKSDLFPLGAEAAKSEKFPILAPSNELLTRSFATTLH